MKFAIGRRHKSKRKGATRQLRCRKEMAGNENKEGHFFFAMGMGGCV